MTERLTTIIPVDDSGNGDDAVFQARQSLQQQLFLVATPLVREHTERTFGEWVEELGREFLLGPP